ncbi:thioesterase domain-containing protein [Oleomonas cavernae]|uniref:thioesterase domain-containing protein n=1 Tax=Oleomonas cavernae TaxID=2320859 RepID=UPI00131446EB|nr:thioesterase domain-containing protein [Oleomonas cavernae]
MLGLGWGYAGLLRYLGADRPLYALQSHGLTRFEALPQSVEAIAQNYLGLIRGVQPHGPYHLLGWSFGGLVAHEIARRLRDGGEAVAFLGLLDAYPFVTQLDEEPGEAAQVTSALSFLGYDKAELGEAPLTMAALADFICAQYDVFAIPVVQDMQRKHKDLFACISAVIENNMRLARGFTPAGSTSTSPSSARPRARAPISTRSCITRPMPGAATSPVPSTCTKSPAITRR